MEDAHAYLSWSRTVPRELVHRRTATEVFLTDMTARLPNVVVFAVQLPRWHIYFGRPDAGTDSLLIAEAFRQAILMASHSHFGVPLKHKFMLDRLSLLGRSAHWPAAVTAEVAVTITLTFVAWDVTGHVNAGERGRYRIEVLGHVRAGRETIAETRCTGRIVPEQLYERLRSSWRLPDNVPRPVGPARLDPLSPGAVGHQFHSNVLLAAPDASGHWPVTADTTNPFYFDHKQDHLPGMAALEAARQALRIRVADPEWDFADFSAEFRNYIDLDVPAVVAVEPAASGFSVSILQHRRPAAVINVDPLC